MSGRIRQIISQVLRDDNNPPTADYSPYDYGLEVGQRLDERALADLVIECVRHLPSSLAESFLNGALEERSGILMKNALLKALPQGHETDSASAVLSLLRERSLITRLDLAMHILSEIRETKEAKAQDIYAFAMLIMLGDRQQPGSIAAIELGQQGHDYELIIKALSNLPTTELTSYARKTLERCLRQT